MMLALTELMVDPIDQTVMPSRHTNIEAIRPHIYRHNFPAGSLKLQIIDVFEDVIAESDPVEIADIGTEDYFHGYVSFIINAFIHKDQAYTIRLVGEDGYTFDESAYCGWVNGYDLAKYPNSNPPVNDFTYPYDYEIWERKTK